MSDPWLGKVIDGFTLIVELGRGGSGTVYRARPTAGGPDVAMKLLRPDPEHKRHADRMRREFLAARRLSHPNALQILGIGDDGDGRTYLLLELLEGETLRARLSRAGPFPPEEAAGIASEVLPVLAEAHAVGLVHRDLKPENIFLTTRPRAGVKVLDFGLVKLMTGTDHMGRLTRTGMIGGTPRYVSPENARGLELDGRSDLYSLGIILFEMISGTAPFVAAAPLDQLLMHIEAPVPTLVAAGGTLPSGLEALVYRCLEKRPDRRPRGAAEMLAELRAMALRGVPAPQADPGVGRRVPAGEALSTESMDGVPVAGSESTAGRLHETRTADVPKASRPSRWRWAAGALLFAAGFLTWLLWGASF